MREPFARSLVLNRTKSCFYKLAHGVPDRRTLKAGQQYRPSVKQEEIDKFCCALCASAAKPLPRAQPLGDVNWHDVDSAIKLTSRIASEATQLQTKHLRHDNFNMSARVGSGSLVDCHRLCIRLRVC